MKNLLIAVLILLAFLVGRYFVPTASEPSYKEGASCDEMGQFKEDFIAYQHLQTAEERYRKADEILGKIMTVFLADLGLRMTKPVVATSSVETAPKPSTAANDHRDANQPAAKPPVASPEVSPSEVSGGPTKLVAWTQHETELRETRNEEDVKDLLKKSEIKDFFSQLKNSVPMSQAQINSISGKFSGEIQLFAKKEVLGIEWSLDLSRKGDKVTGTSETSVYVNGKRVSHGTSNGDNETFLAVPGSQAVLVKVYGGQGYLQIYPNERLDRIFANYYEKKGLDQFSLAGIATLRRVP